MRRKQQLAMSACAVVGGNYCNVSYTFWTCIWETIIRRSISCGSGYIDSGVHRDLYQDNSGMSQCDCSRTTIDPLEISYGQSKYTSWKFFRRCCYRCACITRRQSWTCKMYKAIVFPTLLFSAETFTLCRRHGQITVPCSYPVSTTYPPYPMETPHLKFRNASQFRLAGYTARMNDSKIPKAVFYGELFTEGNVFVVASCWGTKLLLKDARKVLTSQ